MDAEAMYEAGQEVMYEAGQEATVEAKITEEEEWEEYQNARSLRKQTEVQTMFDELDVDGMPHCNRTVTAL